VSHAPEPRLGRPRVHLRSTDSTNERARVLAAAGAPHGTLVTTAAQSSGRGRQGRSWSAPPGSSLLMSLVLRPAPRLTPLVAAVAVCDALRASGAPQARIKWPNDIVVEGAGGLEKLAGILVEGRPQEGWAVLGIGVNVAVELEQLPPEVRGRAATLGLGQEAVEPLLEDVLAALQRRLGQTPRELIDAWSARDVLRGREVSWGSSERPRHGTAAGIDGDGRLIVELPGGGRTELEAGEVHLQPAGG
jgi:BirA family transcriptional regulator, biotin operon repressor / biotin---[acetyl-CoA-carboxylase] ligase